MGVPFRVVGRLLRLLTSLTPRRSDSNFLQSGIPAAAGRAPKRSAWMSGISSVHMQPDPRQTPPTHRHKGTGIRRKGCHKTFERKACGKNLELL